MNWIPLHVHSHFSLLDGLSKPEQIVERIKECGYIGCAISDHGNLAACPSFHKNMKKAGLKPILGCEFYISAKDATIRDNTNNKHSHLVVLAKNLQGWKNLIKASSTSASKDYFYKKPRLSLEQLASFSDGQFIVFSGHLGSDLANICFDEPKLAYKAKTYEEARKLVRKDWKEKVLAEITKYKTLFGESNFYLEIQLIDKDNLPASEVVAKILRWASEETKTPKIATSDSHYCRKEDAADQRILLCSLLDTTLKEVYKKIDNEEEVGLSTFFNSNNYHIPTLEEMGVLHTPDELENTIKIAEMCEIYNITNPAILPEFKCPNNKTQKEYLKELAVNGWKCKIDKLLKNKPQLKEIYADRAKKELEIINDFNLAGYFLIVQDYISHSRDFLQCKCGRGRGSASGCLISYLLDITRIDPVEYDLLFERFISYGRFIPTHINFDELPFK